MRLAFASVGRRFDAKDALRDVSMSVSDGEIVAVVGPSGSGKTTLLRIANLLERPTAGAVRLDGLDPWAAGESGRQRAQRRMAMVFQNPTMLARTVLANAGYGLYMRGMGPDEANGRAKAALDAVGLGDMCNQYAPTLSSGEAQRLAFARATVFGPELLLLDEYTANLDPENVALLERAVTEYRKRTNAAIVIATHNLHQARRIADRTVFLLGGKVIEQGPTARLFKRPRHKLTRLFLTGEMAW